MMDSTPPEQDAARAPPPRRLKLEVDEPLLRFMRSVLAQAPRAEEEEEDDDDQQREPAKKGWQRLRRVAIRSLQLGQRKIIAGGTDEVDIVAKFLYSKPRKIVCQLRRGDALVRIDILWSNIRAMSARFDDDASFDTLTIEVKSSSERYRAKRPPPRMHLQWRRSEQLTTRTFCLQFDKGTLERSYGKMLYTDPSMMLLPPPPPCGHESQAATDAQGTGMITAAAPVHPSVDDVEAEMPSTRMVGLTNTGANVATDYYGGTQLYDPSRPAHMHPLYR